MMTYKVRSTGLISPLIQTVFSQKYKPPSEFPLEEKTERESSEKG